MQQQFHFSGGKYSCHGLMDNHNFKPWLCEWFHFHDRIHFVCFGIYSLLFLVVWARGPMVLDGEKTRQ